MRVGIDLVEVARIADLAARRGQRGLERLFTAAELAYALSARPPLRYQRLAARFAAKEAFRKAMGRPIAFRDLEVRKAGSVPYLAWGEQTCSLSLTHTRDLAGAMVILPQVAPPPRKAP
ncbi:MAG: holo-ACP synthase [Candidatus Bipolaricaulaceae bacterium]